MARAKRQLLTYSVNGSWPVSRFDLGRGATSNSSFPDSLAGIPIPLYNETVQDLSSGLVQQARGAGPSVGGCTAFDSLNTSQMKELHKEPPKNETRI